MLYNQKNNKILKNIFINVLMNNGQKKTSEKILLKSLKSLQRLNKKESKKIIQQSITDLALVFKTKNQITKRGKRKILKNINTILINEDVRMISSLKLLKSSILLNNNNLKFYQKLTQEILLTVVDSSKSFEKKKELQKQLFLNKRYLANFRW